MNNGYISYITYIFQAIEISNEKYNLPKATEKQRINSQLYRNLKRIPEYILTI